MGSREVCIIDACYSFPYVDPGIAQLLIESAPWIGCVPSSVKRPTNLREKLNSLQTLAVEIGGEVKVQNSTHVLKVQNSMDNGLKTVDSVPKKSLENNVPKVQTVSENEVKVQKVSVEPTENVLKVQQVVEDEVKAQSSLQDRAKVQNSLGSVSTVQRSLASPVEEVEPAADKVVKEEEPAPRVKESDLATPFSWTGNTSTANDKSCKPHPFISRAKGLVFFCIQ